LVPIKYGVKVYEVLYESQLPDGSPICASGMYFVPQRTDAAPLVSYNHGTTIIKASKTDLSGERTIALGYSAYGFRVAYPDYFGLGKGDGFHPYQHAETEAQANIDLLRAIRQIDAQLGVQDNGQLFLTGYSQGGHAAMATHKFIQEKHADEFTVTASAPLSGAYDMTGIQGEVMFKPYSHPGYLPYLLFGYNTVYKFFDHPSQLLASPYDTLLPPLMDGTHGFKEVNNVMPEIPKDIFHAEVVEQFLRNPDFVFRRYLEESNVYDWTPKAPILMCYCEADEQVDYRNALKAKETMDANGAANVRAKSMGKKYRHGKCAIFSSLQTSLYFDSFVKGSKKGKLGPLHKRLLIQVVKLRIRP
jgi:pimeloyl-ACP methyl ester carboxylesterase